MPKQAPQILQIGLNKVDKHLRYPRCLPAIHLQKSVCTGYIFCACTNLLANTKNQRMKINSTAAALLATVVLFTNCKKEINGSDANGSSFAFQVKAANPSTALNRIAADLRTDGSATIQWTAGTATANLLKFEAKNASGEVEFKQNVQQTIDLFSASSVLGKLTVAPGTYSEVEFKAFLVPAGNNNALELNGTFTSGGTAVPVSFRVSSAVELKAEKANITVAAGSAYSALNTLDLSQLAKGITEADLLGATRTGNTIVLSANSNSRLYSILLSNLGKHHGEAEVEHD